MKSAQYEKGLAMRRAVLGDSHVDASLADVDDFNGPIQELVTETAWGGVWARPGLELKTRSMLNLAMLTALNHPHELKAHVRGALRNGVTPIEIREVLMQAAIYCGMPAALDAFRTARTVIKDYAAEQRVATPAVDRALDKADKKVAKAAARGAKDAAHKKARKK